MGGSVEGPSDGREGRVEFGVARVTGDHDNYQGFNRFGGLNAECPGGIRGKGHGAPLSIGGVLYVWFTPSAITQGFDTFILYRSRDKGCTWTPLDAAFTRVEDGISFGSFVQFGKDYGLARDAYVYTVAGQTQAHHDLPSGAAMAVPGIAVRITPPEDCRLRAKVAHRAVMEYTYAQLKAFYTSPEWAPVTSLQGGSWIESGTPIPDWTTPGTDQAPNIVRFYKQNAATDPVIPDEQPIVGSLGSLPGKILDLQNWRTSRAPLPSQEDSCDLANWECVVLRPDAFDLAGHSFDPGPYGAT